MGAKDILSHPLTLLGVALAGWGTGSFLNSDEFTMSPGYAFGASLLLGVGLVASTRGIEPRAIRADLGIVLAAVTLGVLAKAAMIGAVMFAAFHQPTALVLGVVVAQIDPLSVAAMQRGDRLSARGRTILAIWAAFDDPVTVLLTIYASAFGLRLGDAGGSAHGSTGDQLWGLGADVVRNIGFILVALLIWCGGRWLRRRIPGGGVGRAPTASRRSQRVLSVCAVVLLGLIVVFGAWRFLMLGLAVIGLFFRPSLGWLLDAGTRIAFVIAAFVLGLLATRGINLLPGVVLGVAAYLSQALVSVVISRGLATRDRWYLAAAQQNGITAVILAVLLEPDFPGIAGVVAPAVITVGVLYTMTNALLNRHYRRAAGDCPEPTSVDTGDEVLAG